MMAYAKIVDKLMGRFVKAEVIQIPREENVEADKLARIASLVEGTWTDEIVLCNADAKLIKAEIQAIEIMEDWRTPIIRALKGLHESQKPQLWRVRAGHHAHSKPNSA